MLKELAIGAAGLFLLDKMTKNGTQNGTSGNGYCPYPTQDIRLNTKNRNYAVKEFMYGPLNPLAPNKEYWYRLASVFKQKGQRPTREDIAGAKKALCGNCGVFDISPRMQECLPPLTDADEYDRYAIASGSVLGYCWVHHFKCASARTCETWVVGGPIRDDARSAKMSKKYGRGPKKPVGGS